MLRPFALFALLAAPALAETRLSPEAFERMSTGRTLYFTLDGRLFGAEQYGADRRVIWRFAGGECQRGFWWAEEGDAICFAYRGSGEAQCWGFYRDDEGYFARSEADEAGPDLRVAASTTEPLPCEGPDAGV